MSLTSNKPFVSIVVSAYNEAEIIEKNLDKICNYMTNLDNYNWELVFINDGSNDGTGKIADEFAEGKGNVKILHNKTNLFLGNSLRKAFQFCKGEYIVTLDIDLSYSTEHIEKMLSKMIETNADVVIASPYMKGGKVSGVPFIRGLLSKVVNKFLSFLPHQKIYTFTSMVRAYNGNFLRNLSLKAQDFEINTETIYKTLLLRGRIVEIPAHLDWSYEKETPSERKSKVRFVRGILSGLMSGFIFRPYIFFMFLGSILMILSLYLIMSLIINTIEIYPYVTSSGMYFNDTLSAAIAEIFRIKPHVFFVAGISLILSIQFLSLGFLSLQSKRYFEELFHLNTTILKNQNNQR